MFTFSFVLWQYDCDYRLWVNLPTGGHGYVSCMGGGVLTKIIQKVTQRPTKVHFFPYKQISSINGDHQWIRMTNAFILCDLLWKFQKSHAANRDGSFKTRHETILRLSWDYPEIIFGFPVYLIYINYLKSYTHKKINM